MCILVTLFEDQLMEYMWIYSQTFYFVSFFCMSVFISVFMSVPLCFEYCGFVIDFETIVIN